MAEQNVTASGRQAHNWWSIRAWEGTQHRAFEELCFQLRDTAPPGWETIKTAAPDGGVEWYDQAPDKSQAHGFQVKYVRDIGDLLPQARESAKTVASNLAHRKIVELTFLVPFDLPDPTPIAPSGSSRVGARDKWNNNVSKWKTDFPALADVKIRLVGGGELLDRLTEPGHEGRRWFFFEQHVFGAQWCNEQMAIAQRIAEARYTPQHHIPLPLSNVADACALAPGFLQLIADHSEGFRSSIANLANHLDAWQRADDGVLTATPGPGQLAAMLREDTTHLADALTTVVPATGFPAASASELLNDVAAHIESAGVIARNRLRDLDDGQRTSATPKGSSEGTNPATTDRLRGLLTSLQDDYGPIERAYSATAALNERLTSSAARAAEARAWLLLGEAGQGKTHLLVDAAHRAVDAGRPALVVFGHELSGTDALTEIALRRGLGDLASRHFLQAMDAAGAASGCRFLLIIDALNDSEDPARWKTQLPALLGALAPYEHIALVISCRTTLRSVVLPKQLEPPHSIHPGFAGHEAEALESYLRHIPSALPRSPLLTPAFSNPLFVKLYADSLRSAHHAGSAQRTNPRDRSAVFDAYVDNQAHAICDRLRLDPQDRPVHAAIKAFAARLALSSHAVLGRSEARAIVDAYAPAAQAWPDTMLGQMISHGLLSNEYMYGAEPPTGVGFPYQAFGDDRIVRSVLALHHEEVEQLTAGGTLAADSPLRTWLESASPGHLEAATVLLPERIGTELIDLIAPSAQENDTAPGRSSAPRDLKHLLLARHLIATLPLRSADSVTEHTVALLNHFSREYGQEQALLECSLAVTADPGHRLNADHLHRSLLALTRPERDATWGIQTYAMLGEPTALHRLLRWAEQTPTPTHLHPESQARPRRTLTARPGLLRSPQSTAPATLDADTVRLAATTLIWTLTSSNRFLRDRATKALVQLLLGHPGVLSSLVDEFMHENVAAVDDPYLFERLVLVAYGVLARCGQPAQQVETVAQKMLAYVYRKVDSPAHASRNALLCDAAGRIVRMASSAGLITPAQAAIAAHPHECPMPGEPHAKADEDELFPWKEKPANESWSAFHFSLSSMGDFASYEIEPAVRHFSLLPLSTPRPRQAWERRHEAPELEDANIPIFAQSLPGPTQAALGAPAAVKELLTKPALANSVLNDIQRRFLQECRRPAPIEERLAAARVDGEWASRWVLSRVAELGWTPAQFGEFDRSHGRGHGSRQGHKAERIGKKYQWVALHELIERLANHQHMHQEGPHDPPGYPGAAQMSLLDLDPTLPPARHRFDNRTFPNDQDRTVAETFPKVSASEFWVPTSPILPDQGYLGTWISDAEVPNLTFLGTRTDPQTGRKWVVLHEYASDTFTSQSPYNEQSEQWHILHSWTVPNLQRRSLMKFLENRSLMGRWMPEPPDRHRMYLTEFPTEPGPWTDPEDGAWQVKTFRYEADDENPTRSGNEVDSTQADVGNQELSAVVAAYAGTSPSVDDVDGINPIHAWRGRQEATRQDRLLRLAESWETGPVPQEDWLESLLAKQAKTAHIDEAMGPGKGHIIASPTSQGYNWSGQGYDCSIDSSVNILLPSDILLRGSGLRREPDGTRWFDSNGYPQVQYLETDRATGRVNALIVGEAWLLDRLAQLGLALIQGTLGELRATDGDRMGDPPREWREFSQTASVQCNGERRYGPMISEVKQPARQR